MTLYPVFRSRSFVDISQPALLLTVRSCSWRAEGGPSRALLEGSLNNLNDLDALLGLLRCPLDLVTDSGAFAWWGLVWSVRITDGSLMITASLDDLRNRVRVVYGSHLADAQGGGKFTVTTWLDDALSQAALGIKEAQIDLDLANQTQAEAWRAIRVALDSKLKFRSSMARTPVVGPLHLEIEARGWWDTLNWKFYSNPAGLVENIVREPNLVWCDCGATNRVMVAQSFQTTMANWKPDYVWMMMRRNGLPGQNAYMSIYSDSGGVPGSNLATSTGINIDTVDEKNFKWVCFTIQSPPLLAAGTTYWAVTYRNDAFMTGTVSYRILGDQSLSYPSGSVAWYDGVNWTAWGYDLQFRVSGTMETTEQLKLMSAVGTYGQFITGIKIINGSGIYTNPYRSGARTSLSEIVQHLQTGSSSLTRMLATITQDRCLVVNIMPAESTAALTVGRDGIIRQPGGMIAPPGNNLAGLWSTIDTPWAINAAGWGLLPGRMFLEAVEWSGGLCRPSPAPYEDSIVATAGSAARRP